MECRIVRYDEYQNIANKHPELASQRPDLTTPAFLTNPVQSDGDFPYLFYFLQDGNIVGSRRAIPDRLYHGSDSYAFAWCFDTYVNRNFHGKGIGTKLVAVQSEQLSREGYISGAAFSAPAMMRIYEKLGYNVLGFVPKYALLRNTKPFLAAKIRSDVATSIVASFANTVLKTWSALSFPDPANDITVEVADTRAIEFKSTELERASMLRWDCDPSWVVARLQESDHIYVVRKKLTGRPSAALVARLRDQSSGNGAMAVKRLTIMHFIANDDDAEALEYIAAAARVLLRRTKADVVDIITSSPELERALRKHGFRRRGDGMTYVFKVPPNIKLCNADTQANWHLTHFCSDGFTFE